MEIQVAVPVPAPDFNFDSACSSPFMTAPSSPQHFAHFFFSAPASPSRRQKAAETQPETDGDFSEEDFEFGFSGNPESAYLSAADELFDGGRIRPLNPASDFQQLFSASSPRSPRSPKQGKSRNSKNRESDPIEAALMEETRKSVDPRERGRTRTCISSSYSTPVSSGYVRNGSRSLSPLRISDIIFEPDNEENHRNSQASVTNNNGKSYASAIFSAISFPKTYKKWSLKDFLLFRSASEGRAADKETLRKYGLLSKTETGEVKGSSFRSTGSEGSVSRRRGAASAHELHYTTNRAVAEEMRRKTFLPYRQGLLGCMRVPGELGP